VQVDFDKLFDFIFKISGFVLHVQSAPVDPFDILEPFVPNQLTPYCQTDSCSRVAFEEAESVLFFLEDDADVVAL
jgi:hypothetical protein